MDSCRIGGHRFLRNRENGTMEEGSLSSKRAKTHYVDDLYFSILCDHEETFPISDEKYAEELTLQEALMSAAIYSRLKSKTFETENQSAKKEKFTERRETGESSQRSLEIPVIVGSGKGKMYEVLPLPAERQFHCFCSICMDAKHAGEMFRNNSCSHSFCADCIGKHVAAKIQENITMVKCPDLNCKGVLEPEVCRAFVPVAVFDRWENALCESMILVAQKFYCPFKDCSAVLVDDGGEFVTVSECPNCHRLFCAQCKVSWHAGIECREFQSLKKGERQREDIMLMELAKNKKWRRCKKCKFYVEKVEGCVHITCRCGYQFCYGCGSKWSAIHNCGLS